MREKVIIPNRGVVALDIIDSLKSIGLETILLHSPDDSGSLPVRLADRSYKFFSSRMEDSYLDRNTIIEKALELDARFIHPGHGFLAEDPGFARLCEENQIKCIGPDADVLESVQDKIHLRKIAAELGIKTIDHSKAIKSPLDIEAASSGLKLPLIAKPITGLGGHGIRVIGELSSARNLIDDMLQREYIRQNGLFLESYHPEYHHIEIPFFRDIQGNILFLPEIESSIQRRFQKIVEESPSVNISNIIRETLYHDTQKIIEKINYQGLGYVEFLVGENSHCFFEINPTFQINTLIPEIHLISNCIKKQFAISNNKPLHQVRGTEIVKPKFHIILVALMAENPFDHFQPSSGTVSEFYNYSTIRNIFKSSLFTGARISHLYDPYIGKIVTFSTSRTRAINDMKNFLNHIHIRGIATNLHFLKSLLDSEPLRNAETSIDFINRRWDYSKRKKSDPDILKAAALLASAFHIDNQKKNYKSELQKMKQPGFFRRLFRRF